MEVANVPFDNVHFIDPRRRFFLGRLLVLFRTLHQGLTLRASVHSREFRAEFPCAIYRPIPRNGIPESVPSLPGDARAVGGPAGRLVYDNTGDMFREMVAGFSRVWVHRCEVIYVPEGRQSSTWNEATETCTSCPLKFTCSKRDRREVFGDSAEAVAYQPPSRLRNGRAAFGNRDDDVKEIAVNYTSLVNGRPDCKRVSGRRVVGPRDELEFCPIVRAPRCIMFEEFAIGLRDVSANTMARYRDYSLMGNFYTAVIIQIGY
ncbi:hypothetical protein EVAR_89167_1 [Eumeta japonica]|uniref:Uncharacterized protein n=1 Tax=Eumeta variegata TaxID=151549 RepID=A0A4C1Z1Y7_EUMVA|nr:hypothetical protein EVAR_89167_1 [Eumeta japonica]